MSKCEKVDGWVAESPLSQVSVQGRVVGLEKALCHVEMQEGEWMGGRKPFCLTFQRKGGW